jgi:hypothetical protein
MYILLNNSPCDLEWLLTIWHVGSTTIIQHTRIVGGGGVTVEIYTYNKHYDYSTIFLKNLHIVTYTTNTASITRAPRIQFKQIMFLSYASSSNTESHRPSRMDDSQHLIRINQ